MAHFVFNASFVVHLHYGLFMDTSVLVVGINS